MSTSLAHKTAWSAVASVCFLSGRFVAQVIIARMLGPEGVGRIAYIAWLIEIANVLSGFGLISSLTRYLAELHGQKKVEQASRFAQWVFVRYLMLAVLGAAAVGLLYFCSSQYRGAESILPMLMVLFLAYGLQAINQADLVGRQRFTLLARINMVATVALVAGVAVGARVYGVAGALCGYFVGALFPAACSFTMLRNLFPWHGIAPDLRRRVWRFAFHNWLALIVSAFVWSRMEIFFLERYWDAREIAMFTVGLSFVVMIRQVATLFSGSFLAHFSQLVGEGNHALIQRHYETATRLMAFVIAPLAFGGAAVMPALIPALLGPAFAPAVPNAMVLTATSVLAFSLIGSSLIYARERSDFIALGGVAGAAMSVVAGFLIVSRFGAWGAVWSRLVVQSSLIALGIWFLVARLRVAYPFKSLGRILVAAVLCALPAWWATHAIDAPSLALAVAVPLGAAVYILSARLLRVLDASDVRQLKRILQRLPEAVQSPVSVLLSGMTY